MDRLTEKSRIIPKHSKDIKSSRIGIGFEKLDRGVFDPEKAYDKVGEIGVKWVRIQSGWARTEKEKGVYDFAWLDSIVDNLIARGLVPWICLCYGNGVYDENAAKIFGSVGVPPIFNDEQKNAWKNYVKALVSRYKDKVSYYEVWNEPDGQWCWKHGVSGTELGIFTADTARAVKEAMPEAKVVGGVVCDRRITFLNEALSTGMGKYIDRISFHEYTNDETLVPERVECLRALAHKYNPDIEIIQGESGSQSRRGGNGALSRGAWTQERQAKQLARHAMADILSDVEFTSYFSCRDMIEALSGTVDNKSSYLDYGYFGVLGAEFDSNGISSGEYKPKKSYYVLQNIASLFAGNIEVCDIPCVFISQFSEGIYEADCTRREIMSGSVKNSGGEAFIYWNPTNIMTSSFEGTASFELYSEYDKVSLVDIMDGKIYELPEEIVKRDEFGVYRFEHLPVKDTPLVLAFGNFIG